MKRVARELGMVMAVMSLVAFLAWGVRSLPLMSHLLLQPRRLQEATNCQTTRPAPGLCTPVVSHWYLRYRSASTWKKLSSRGGCIRGKPASLPGQLPSRFQVSIRKPSPDPLFYDDCHLISFSGLLYPVL